MNGRNRAAELALINGISPPSRALPECSRKNEWKAEWASTRRSGSWGRALLAMAASSRRPSVWASGVSPRSAASRAPRPSMTSRISYMSRISAAVKLITSTVRLLFDVRRKPSFSRMRKASRRGVRLTPSWLARSIWSSWVPGGISPRTIFSRSTRTTSSTSRGRLRTLRLRLVTNPESTEPVVCLVPTAAASGMLYPGFTKGRLPMPLRDDMHLISVDDHLIEHRRVWLDRLPAKYQDVCPQVVESGDEGIYSEFGTYVKPHSQAWLYEGHIHAQMGLNAVAGKPPEALGLDPVRYEDMIPGCYDPVERVKDMDL